MVGSRMQMLRQIHEKSGISIGMLKDQIPIDENFRMFIGTVDAQDDGLVFRVNIILLIHCTGGWKIADRTCAGAVRAAVQIDDKIIRKIHDLVLHVLPGGSAGTVPAVIKIDFLQNENLRTRMLLLSLYQKKTV